MIRDNPSITRELLSKALDISKDSVKYRLDKLKKSGAIEREESTKGGKWIIKQ